MRTAGPSNTHNRHKVAFNEQVKDAIRISDIVIELLDARFIEESRISEMEDYVNGLGKKLLFVITKSDLISSDIRGKINGLKNPILISSITRQGISSLRERIIIESKKLKQKRKIHVTLVGYPNSGKSTLINLLVRRNAAPVSSQPGWTKAIRRIRLNKDISIIDVPGIISSGENLFQGNASLIKHSNLGVQIPESVRNPDLIVSDILSKNQKTLENFYSIAYEDDVDLFLEKLAFKLGFMKKGGLLDIDRAARQVLKDWQKRLPNRK